MNVRKGLRALVSGAIVGGVIAVVVWAERRRPLRARREDSLRHTARDLALASLSVAATSALQPLLLRRLHERLRSERVGLLGALSLPAPLRVIAGVLLLDYTLWIWHWLNHRVPALWRFHRAHHVDLDMDAATGARFHFGEMSLSVMYRWLQLRVIGPDPLAVSIWHTALMASIAFHHSNLRLSERVDCALAAVIVTPRMHGIHHSIVNEETNSNWASLFTLWDWLHGTLRLDVPQELITVGVPAYQRFGDVTLPRVIAMPLAPTEGDWTPTLPSARL